LCAERPRAWWFGKPSAPAVSSTAGDVKVFFYPGGKSAILVNAEMATCALGAELFAKIVQQGSQVLLRSFFELEGFEILSISMKKW
jgi:hypothetical protein